MKKNSPETNLELAFWVDFEIFWKLDFYPLGGGPGWSKVKFFLLILYEFILYTYILNFDSLRQSEVLFSRGGGKKHPPRCTAPMGLYRCTPRVKNRPIFRTIFDKIKHFFG